MTPLWLSAAFLATSLTALGQGTNPFTFYIDDTTASSDTPLPATFQLTPSIVGNDTPLVLKMVNSSTTTVYLNQAVVSDTPDSQVPSANFSVSGSLAQNQTLAPGNSVLFTVNLIPAVAGNLIGYLSVSFQVQQGGCSFTDPSNACPSSLLPVSALTSVAYANVGSVFTVYQLTGANGIQAGTFPATDTIGSVPVGSANQTYLQIVNSSAYAVDIAAVVVSSAINSSSANQNFSTVAYTPITLSQNGPLPVTVSFAPQTVGATTGFLNVWFQVQEGTCLLGSLDRTAGCPVYSLNLSTLNAVGTPPQLTVSYQTPSGPVQLTPSSATFDISPTQYGSTTTVAFTLTNSGAAAMTTPIPTLSIGSSISQGAFTLDTSQLPSTLAPGASANFNLTFAPQLPTGGSTGTPFPATLVIGPNEFPVQGTGIMQDTQLVVAYSGTNKVYKTAQPVSFDQGEAASLTFCVSNPSASYSPVEISKVTVSGVAFSLSGLPTLPVTLTPGDLTPQSTTCPLSFVVSFTPTGPPPYTGTLNLGNLAPINLLGTAAPAASFPTVTISLSPAASGQQATLTLQTASPPPNSVLELTMQFAPSVANVSDDSAIKFPKTGGRQLNLNMSGTSQSATFEGDSNIIVATGTTAGTLTFTVSYLGSVIATQPFTLAPAEVQMTQTQAAAMASSLSVTVTGYDNTYSAGPLLFTFYDTSGKQIGSPIPYNATSAFNQLFFTSNTDGGMFQFDANFTVTGDIAKIGSVTVGVTNSQGQSTSTASF